MPILKWLTRDEDLKSAGKAAYRLLREVPELGAGDKDSGNMIIQGDNLEALKALLPFYAGQVKCVYIDPPFNTGSRITSDGQAAGYDDNFEHSIWLSMMYSRIEMLRDLLKEDGAIFLHINMEEQAYLKVICDEIFGRKNFLQLITVKAASTASFRAINLCPVTVTEYILMYAKNRSYYHEKMHYIPAEYSEDYGTFIENINKPVDSWRLVSLSDTAMQNLGFSSWQEMKKSLGDAWKIVRKKEMERIAMQNPDAIVSLNTLQKPAAYIQEIIDKSKTKHGKVFEIKRENANSVFVYNGRTLAFFSGKLRMIDNKLQPTNVLTNFWDDINYLSLGLEGGVDFLNGKKPEALLRRILDLCTQKGDLILDSFLGSGTTAAVAHKMKRQYIGIEMAEHAKTHTKKRLENVINGDRTGISELVGWTGGGGFRFYTLGDTILDEDGKIRDTVAFEQLAAHIWFYETKTPFDKPKAKSTFLGVHNETAYALLYNGVLQDKRINGGNVLTAKTLAVIFKDTGKVFYKKLVVYGVSSRIGLTRLKELGIEFKQTPYDVRAK